MILIITINVIIITKVWKGNIVHFSKCFSFSIANKSLLTEIFDKSSFSNTISSSKVEMTICFGNNILSIHKKKTPLCKCDHFGFHSLMISAIIENLPGYPIIIFTPSRVWRQQARLYPRFAGCVDFGLDSSAAFFKDCFTLFIFPCTVFYG